MSWSTKSPTRSFTSYASCTARRSGLKDWSKAVRATFPELKPSTTTISLRVPASMLEELKTLANETDVPYQSLMKVYLAERIARERGSRRPFRAPLARHSRESGNPSAGPPRARG
ncbi:MAG: BrnA antitoxin family protein [Terriglobia bacterium]